MRDVILDRVTPKQSITYCGRRLVTDTIAHVGHEYGSLNKISRLAWNPLTWMSSAVSDIQLFFWFASLRDQEIRS